MKIKALSSTLIACICEGGAETAIMNILLEEDLLIFSKNQLVDETLIHRTSVREFERRYLRREYDQKIVILRVIDSRREEFKLGRAYRCQVDGVITVLTPPEIEILIIVSKGKYDEFCRSDYLKPSEYCKAELKMNDVKSPRFVSEYFQDAKFLVDTIKEYHRVHPLKANEISLFDLLKCK